jgi:hypothetical protein
MFLERNPPIFANDRRIKNAKYVLILIGYEHRQRLRRPALATNSIQIRAVTD